MRRLGTALGIGLLVWSFGGAVLSPARGGGERLAHITHYWATGEPMATGIMPYPGAAACSTDLALYSWVSMDGDTLQCLDRGALGDGAQGWSWVDVYGFCGECVYGAWTYVETDP